MYHIRYGCLMAGAGMASKCGANVPGSTARGTNEMLASAKSSHDAVMASGGGAAAALSAGRAAAQRVAPAHMKASHAPPPVPVRSATMGAASAARFVKVREAETARLAAAQGPAVASTSKADAIQAKPAKVMAPVAVPAQRSNGTDGPRSSAMSATERADSATLGIGGSREHPITGKTVGSSSHRKAADAHEYAEKVNRTDGHVEAADHHNEAASAHRQAAAASSALRNAKTRSTVQKYQLQKDYHEERANSASAASFSAHQPRHEPKKPSPESAHNMRDTATMIKTWYPPKMAVAANGSPPPIAAAPKPGPIAAARPKITAPRDPRWNDERTAEKARQAASLAKTPAGTVTAPSARSKAIVEARAARLAERVAAKAAVAAKPGESMAAKWQRLAAENAAKAPAAPVAAPGKVVSMQAARYQRMLAGAKPGLAANDRAAQDVGRPFGKGNSAIQDRIQWASIKARETGKDAYLTIKDGAPHLSYKAPTAGAYTKITPTGTVTSHAAKAPREAKVVESKDGKPALAVSRADKGMASALAKMSDKDGALVARMVKAMSTGSSPGKMSLAEVERAEHLMTQLGMV